MRAQWEQRAARSRKPGTRVVRGRHGPLWRTRLRCQAPAWVVRRDVKHLALRVHRHLRRQVGRGQHAPRAVPARAGEERGSGASQAERTL